MTTEQELREAITLNNLNAIYPKFETLCTDLNERPKLLMQNALVRFRQGILRKQDVKAGEQL